METEWYMHKNSRRIFSMALKSAADDIGDIAPVTEVKSSNIEHPPELAEILSRFKVANTLPGVTSFKLGCFALDKVGKTHLCLSAPRPIYFFDTENKAHIAIEQLEDSSDIHLFNLLTEVKDSKGNVDKDKAIDMLRDTLRGIKNLEEGTIVIDSLSSVWAWIQHWFNTSPEIQRNSSGIPYRFEYGRPNSRFFEIGELLQETKMNIVCTMKSKPKVNSDGSDAGYNIMECQRHTGYFLEFYGELERLGKKRQFTVKGTNYGDLDGFVISDPTFEGIREAISKQSGVRFKK